MKIFLYYTLKVIFFIKMFDFLFCLLGYVEKQLDQKDKDNFKIYDVATWGTNNCNTLVTKYFKNKRQIDNQIWSVNRT